MDKEKQQLMSMLSQRDELLAQIIPTLQQIRDKELILPSSQPLAELLEIQKYQHKKNYEIFYITHPNDGTRATLTAGTTVLDFRHGTVKTAAGVVTKMSTSLELQKKDTMRSFAVNADKDIVVQLGEDDKVPVRTGTWFVMAYQQFEKVWITCTESAEILVAASTSPEPIMHLEKEPNVVSASIQDWTAVAQNTIVKSAEHDLTRFSKVVLSIQAALDTTTAHTGTRFIVQTSSAASGDEDWQDIADFVALIGTAATDLIQGSTLAAGSTAIALTGHAYTVEGIWLFIEDGTLTNSELVFEASQTANEVVILDGTANAHVVGVALFNVAMTQNIALPASARRARVVVDNSYDVNGSTLNYKVRVSKVTGV